MIAPGRKLKEWLAAITNDNAQGEYYLTDILGIAYRDGATVNGVKTDNWTEVMGINDKKQLLKPNAPYRRVSLTT